MNGEFSPEERALLRGRQARLEELESLTGWYPVVAVRDGLWWQHFGKKKFSESFFHDTIAAISQTEKRVLHTGYDAPESFDSTLAPVAFIFHTSRCGSTLLTQLLATLPECIALSEPPAIDSFLRCHYAGQHGNQAEQRLRNIVAALGQKRFAEERRLLIKLDSWHIASLPLFRKAFPGTQFLFLYREPSEIIASHRRQRGRQMVPGLVTASMPPLDFALPEPGDLNGYCAKMLESFLGAACRHSEELLLVNYRQLPHLIWDELLGFLGISPSQEHLAAMKSRAGLHSKSGMAYSGDPHSAEDGRLPSTSLHTLYARLEDLRLKQEELPATNS